MGQRNGLKIAFVGNFKYNLGASNVLLGYVQTGSALGYDIRASELGYVDDTIRASVRVADKGWQPDLMVIVYESYPFLSTADIDAICAAAPRSRRVLIDVDGKYCPPISIMGDTNHPTSDSHATWVGLFDSLSDTILQPVLTLPVSRDIHRFLFYGVARNIYLRQRAKDFDLLYVGTNWYRWDVITDLIEALRPIRQRLRRIAIVGQYWSGNTMPNFPDATYSDPEFFRRHAVEVHPPAPYGDVETTMSRGLINPILIRPVLNGLHLATPRMFETFVADTVPAIQKELSDNALTLYGEDAQALCLSDDPASDILRILDDYAHFQRLSHDIRERLMAEHSYHVRLAELLEFA